MFSSEIHADGHLPRVKNEVDFLLKNSEGHVVVFQLIMKLINGFDFGDILISSDFGLRGKVSAIDLLKKVPFFSEVLQFINSFWEELLRLDFVEVSFHLI